MLQRPGDYSDVNFEGGAQQSQRVDNGEASDKLNTRNNEAKGSFEKDTLKSFKKSPDRQRLTLDQSI